MPFLTRREFLVTSAHLISAASLGRWRDLLPSPQGVTRFAYFSDTHVGLAGNFTQNQQMLAELRGLGNVEWAINGGDVTDYGWRDEYSRYRTLIQEFAIDTVHIPGNHDVRWSPLGPVAFREVCGPVYGFAMRNGVFFALLDSTVPLSHYGHFEAAMLRDLDAQLKKLRPGTPVIVATHHWVGRDSIMVDNESELLKILEPHNVKLILTGHGHQDQDWQWAGIHCTMNKGLYQFSYQTVEVDTAAKEIRLARRTDATKKLQPVVTIPLSVSVRDKRKIFAVRGEPNAIHIALPEAADVRVVGGKWQAMEAGDHVVPLSIGGWKRVEARRGENLQAEKVRSIGGLGVAWERPLSGGVMSHILRTPDHVVVSAMDGMIAAFDADTGKTAWTAKTKGYCHSSPILAQDRIVVGSADGGVYCLDATSGKVVWRVATDGPVYGSAAQVGSHIVIGSGDGSIRALAISDGRELWRWQLPKGNSSFVQSGLATDGTRVFLGAWNSRVYALEAASGKEQWSFVTPKSFAYSPAIGAPTVSGNRLYAVANGNALYCLDTATGAKIWELASPGDKFGYSGPCVVGGVIVAGCLGDVGQVRGVSVRTGRELWCAPVGATIYDSSPATNGKLVAVGSVSGQLNLIEAATGRIVAREMLRPGHFLSSPAIDAKRVYAATYSNWLVAFDLP